MKKKLLTSKLPLQISNKIIGNKESWEYTKSRIGLIYIFSCVGAVIFTIFGLLHLSLGDRVIGYTEISLAWGTVCNIFIFKMINNISITSRIVVIITIIALIALLITGGLNQTGIFWFYSLPAISFFLRGKKEGLFWIAILIFSTLITFHLSDIGYINIPFSHLTIRQLLYSLLVVTILIYFYQDMNEYNQKKLNMLNENLSNEIEKTKTDFIALASHQLRTPITAIRWFTEMLMNEDAGKINQEQKEQLTQIYQSNQRMEKIINSLLTAAQIELNNLPINLKEINLIKLTQGVVNDITTEYLGLKKITIKQEYDNSVPLVKTDPDLIKIILQNLLSNAIKYTPESGKITLKIALNKNKTKQIIISITDTGYGIPESIKSKIFTKFFRGENIKSKDTDGAGLGLYVVKGLIEKISGEITFQSTENKGTTFTMILNQ